MNTILKNYHNIYNNALFQKIISLFLIIGGYFFLFVSDNIFHTKSFCLFKIITGVPCPGCGMGRATICLSKGDIIKSLHYNILAIPFNIFIIIIIIWLLYDIFSSKNSLYNFIKKPLKKHIKIIIFVLLIINWIINIYNEI